jgi:nicotinamidase/pyrazinamidase
VAHQNGGTNDAGRAGRAIIVVDPQPDFFEDGPLPIAGATATAERIRDYLATNAQAYDMAIVTQDWHVSPGDHWSATPDYKATWPVHCAANSLGAQVHESLANVPWDAVIHKGAHEGAYSGFEGQSSDGTPLGELLSTRGVHQVVVVGFATDHCVKATALDARSLGLDVTVALDLSAGVAPETTRAAIAEMEEAGITLAASSDL